MELNSLVTLMSVDREMRESVSLSEQSYVGYLTFEEVPESDMFTRRFFVLDRASARLEYYADYSDWAETEPARSADCCLGHFNIRFISFVSEMSSKRKLPHSFVVIISGDHYRFSADSEQEKIDWIQALQDASRITVPPEPDVVLPLQRNGCRVEIVGGVPHATSLQETPHSAGVKHSDIHQRNRNYIKTGYCIKQGAVRKNWKLRYFVLDTFALSYYANIQDRSPIRAIHVKDIVEARISVGIHLHKQNVFEVVTPLRVFYVQAESTAERQSWIAAVNATVAMVADAAKVSGRTSSDC